MAKIICLMGKSCSGKDTIFKNIRNDGSIPVEVLVPYTTRPIRVKEEDGREYHFVDEQEYRALKDSGSILEERTYNTELGLWRYFTVIDRESFENSDAVYIYIGTLEAYVSMCGILGTDAVKPIYIECDDGDRLERALKRERKQTVPRYLEMCRRFLADSEDFSEEKLKAADIGPDRRFTNDTLEECLARVKKCISEELQGR